MLLLILTFFSLSGFAANKEVKSIVGLDNRHQVLNTTNKPYSMIGSLTYGYAGRIGKCTASLVGPDLILTNAHCVVTKGIQKLYQHHSFKFHPQFQMNQAIPEIDATLLEWGSNAPIEQPSLDWALLRLAIPIGNFYGHFKVSGIRETKSSALIGKTLSTAGYPGDKKNGNQMWAHNGCRITGKKLDGKSGNYGYLKHNCDTTTGASGSPLYANEKGDYVIYGLHSRGASGSVSESNIENHNGAVQTEQIFDAIKRNSIAPKYAELQIATCSAPSNSEMGALEIDMEKIEKYYIGEDRSKFILCNPSEKPYKVAIAHEEVNQSTLKWLSKGFSTIDPKKCSNFDAGHLKESEVYLYIEGWKGLEKSFCLKSEGIFEILDADKKCPEDSTSSPFIYKFNLSNSKPEVFYIAE